MVSTRRRIDDDENTEGEWARDGESYRVPMCCMDGRNLAGVQRSVARARTQIVTDARAVTDGLGGSRMHQPGPRFLVSAPSRRAVADAADPRSVYIQRLCGAYRTPLRDGLGEDVLNHLATLLSSAAVLQSNLSGNGDDDSEDDTDTDDAVRDAAYAGRNRVY